MAPTNGAQPGLVHDYLLVPRGAERTFAAMAACWPDAPIYTLLYDEAAVAPLFGPRDVRTSYLQRLHIGQRGFRYMLPLFPRATEHLDVSGHDLLVTSSSAFAQGVRPRPGAVHVCYCHSPFRYVWFERERALAEAPAPLRPPLKRELDRIRAWDLDASKRVTHYVANSIGTQERIAEIYGRDSVVIHPPVAVDRFSVGTPEDYLLFVGQIVPHKRVEVAIEAALAAGLPIRIVGDGPDLPRLRAAYDRPDVSFLTGVSDAGLATLYAGCLALVVPNIEEFGIAAVEAQAAGRPVVAIERGGVRETVVDGVTGVLVDAEDSGSIAEVLRATDFGAFDPTAIRVHAETFSTESFQRKLTALVERAVADEPQPIRP
ncbi:MAG: glycosyltransferase family 4 protein [Solirubrobacterales bacterium]|nr:glycosyltransferase family 4 protein [Solirubrobacterales bacterium]